MPGVIGIFLGRPRPRLGLASSALSFGLGGRPGPDGSRADGSCNNASVETPRASARWRASNVGAQAPASYAQCPLEFCLGVGLPIPDQAQHRSRGGAEWPLHRTPPKKSFMSVTCPNKHLHLDSAVTRAVRFRYPQRGWVTCTFAPPVQLSDLNPGRKPTPIPLPPTGAIEDRKGCFLGHVSGADYCSASKAPPRP